MYTEKEDEKLTGDIGENATLRFLLLFFPKKRRNKKKCHVGFRDTKIIPSNKHKNKKSQITSTICQYHAAASKPE
jgi:hypothetical protein